MNQIQKAAALDALLNTPGWDVLYDYLQKNSQPSIMPADGLDSLIKQAYKNGVCQGHKDVLDYIKITIENARRKNADQEPELPYPLNLIRKKNKIFKEG